MEDKEIIDLLFKRQENVIGEIEKKYGRYCHYIAYNILENDEDAREIVNDVYVKLWNSVPPIRPTVLKGYIGALCRNLAINRYEMSSTQKRGQIPLALDELSECIPDKCGDIDVSQLSLKDSLNRFVWSLDKRQQRIFVLRYFYADSVSQIADDLKIKEGNVSVILLRIRKKLKKFLEGEGFGV